MSRGARRLLVPLCLLAAGCSTDHGDATLENPFDPTGSGGPNPPDSVGVTVGDNLVRVEWTVPAGTADEYALFRQRIDVEDEDEVLLKRLAVPRYDDAQVRNGRAYAYRVACGMDGQFGRRSDAVEGRPSLFGLVLSGDAARTRETTVSVIANGPNTIVAVQITEDPAFADAPWRNPAGTLSWSLSAGDGEKTVYGRFRMLDGSMSLPVYDTVILDTRAAIAAVGFDGEAVRVPGDAIHFQVRAGETGGRALVDVPGLFESVSCYDDGNEGDPAAGDGVYERSLFIPAGRSVTDATVTGRFTDAAGNAAGAIVAARTLTVREALEPVTLTGLAAALPPDPAAVTVRWTQSQDAEFAAYRVFRGPGTQTGAGETLLGEITAKGTLFFEDRKVAEGATYAYRVSVRTAGSLEAFSGQTAIVVPNLRAPAAVTLRAPEAVSTDRVALGWTRSADLDFWSYRVYRNPTGAVSEDDALVLSTHDADRTYVDDGGLIENTTYHYRVMVLDAGGLVSRSNEVEATTVNEAPLPVVLNPAADVDAGGATLGWTPSGAHDFRFYRVYRDVVPTVSAASTLVVELDDAAVTAFRDDDLASGERYYYRVFVVDDGVDPGPLATGSNTITVDTP